MAADFTIRAGITDPVVLQCKDIDPTTGVESVINLTGAQSVELHVLRHNQAEAQVFDEAQVTITDVVAGEVSFAPGVDDFTAGTYDAWLRIVDEEGTVISVPSDRNFVIAVIKNY